jgi:hypothetical protein
MSELVRAGVTVDTVKAAEVYNRRADIMQEVRHGFGDCVQGYTNDIDNSLNARTRDAIALMPTGNMEGSYGIITLYTGVSLED